MRATLVRFVLCAAMLIGLSVDAAAQDALPKLIRIVVPFAPGGSNDVIARALAGPLAKRLDVSGDRREQAGRRRRRRRRLRGQVAARRLGAAAHVVELPDRGRDAESVALRSDRQPSRRSPWSGRGPMLLVVSATTPYKTPADVVAAARAKPGVLNYGTAGVGSIAHLTTELMDDTAKIQMTHVPYKGAALAAVDLASGQIQMMISNYSTVAPLMKSRKDQGARRHVGQAARGVPRPAAARHGRDRLQRRHLGRRVRAGRHAAVDRRPPQSRDQRRRRVGGPRTGARAGRDAARGDRRRAYSRAACKTNSCSGRRSPPTTESWRNSATNFPMPRQRR